MCCIPVSEIKVHIWVILVLLSTLSSHHQQYGGVKQSFICT